jgi:hypothetical protein
VSTIKVGETLFLVEKKGGFKIFSTNSDYVINFSFGCVSYHRIHIVVRIIID